MSLVSEYQYCKFCGTELIRKEEYSSTFDETRVTLSCPNKKYNNYSIRSIFWRDRHTEEFIEYIDTVLNFDPVTGERIKRDRAK